VTRVTEHEPIYELRAVTRAYGRNSNAVRAVDEVDLEVDEGEFLVVVGPSGSGKTTLLQLLGGLDRPTSGQITFEGRDLARLKDAELSDLRLRTFGFVFQQFNLIPTLTAAQNVEVSLAPRGLGRQDRHASAERLLGSVDLSARSHHLPSRLSGGEQQRVAIARALANEPRVLLADEPTGNLDSATGREIIELLASVASDHRQTFVVVTHDADIASRAGRTLRMQDGRLGGALGTPARS
jgi:putative ABC transport system ATP-binding protein